MLLKVCLAVSGKELTVLDAEEIEGKSAKALKQLGRFQELEVKTCVLVDPIDQGRGLKGFA